LHLVGCFHNYITMHGFTNIEFIPSHPRRLKKIGSYWPTFWDSLSVPSWAAWPMKLESIGFPETSVINYHSTLRKSPEERGWHLHRSWSLKVLICPALPPMFETAWLCSKVPRFCPLVLIWIKWRCRWAWSVYKKILRKENRSTRWRGGRETPCSSVILSTTNITLTGLGSKPVLGG